MRNKGVSCLVLFVSDDRVVDDDEIIIIIKSIVPFTYVTEGYLFDHGSVTTV